MPGDFPESGLKFAINLVPGGVLAGSVTQGGDGSAKYMYMHQTAGASNRHGIGMGAGAFRVTCVNGDGELILTTVDEKRGLQPPGATNRWKTFGWCQEPESLRMACPTRRWGARDLHYYEAL